MRLVSLVVLVAACGARSTRQPDASPTPDASVSDAATPCGAGEEREGCPCDELEPVPCYEGAAETVGVGPCRGGVRMCRDGAWGPCAGQVLPGEEVLVDGIDEDCDGVPDDGLVPEGCGEGCTEIAFGHEPGDIPFDPGADRCLDVSEGDLVGREVPHEALWIPNTTEGTISLVDVAELEELARFRTGPDAVRDRPSRTMVDWNGDVFVANQAPGGQASVTRIRKYACEDRDGDGVIETSAGTALPWGEDECVVWNAPVGGPGAVANALELTGSGTIWVGLQEERKYVEIDPETGEATSVEVDCSPCTPFGATTARRDRSNWLWSACASEWICGFNLDDPAEVEIVQQPGTNAGITTDWDGRVWTGGDVAMLDPETLEWTPVPDVHGFGVAAERRGRDEPMRLWVGDCSVAGGAAGTCTVDGDTLEAAFLPVDSRAVELDDYWETLFTIPTTGVVGTIDLDTFESATYLDDCPGPCLGGPEAYSLMSEPHLSDEGWGPCTWLAAVDGCDAGRIRWTRLAWDAGPAWGYVFSVRVAATRDALADAAWIQVAEDADGDEDDSGEVDLEPFLADAPSRAVLGLRVAMPWWGGLGTVRAPVLHRISVQRFCE